MEDVAVHDDRPPTTHRSSSVYRDDCWLICPVGLGALYSSGSICWPGSITSAEPVSCSAASWSALTPSRRSISSWGNGPSLEVAATTRSPTSSISDCSSPSVRLSWASAIWPILRSSAAAMLGNLQNPSPRIGSGQPSGDDEQHATVFGATARKRSATPPEVWPIEDRGSFTHGVCRSCTWAGPGRRSRGGAASDAELHALSGCESTDTPESAPDVASGRERLTARGRS